MFTNLLRKHPAWLTFWAAFAVAMLFALYTNHTWEDYYITYRSSRNFATGHGLVFNHGDRLHTYTSPLGVLLPALASLLTANSSDPAALWIFRVMSAAAFGGAAMLLARTAHRQYGNWLVAGLLAAWLVTDAKSVDFTINGMETAFMLLFLAYALWSHVLSGPRQWLHLGAAWAGLMWTRPDSFIYIGLLAAGFWLFPSDKPGQTGRRNLFILYLKAGLVTIALYLPWLLAAWWYYGTPIPHTITAKGGIGDHHTLVGLLLTAVQLPYLAWAKSASLELTFLPSYYMIGGWPYALVIISRLLATLCSLLWLVPQLRPWGRAASFAYFGAHLYLTFFPYFPFPWYVPSTTLLALVALGDLVATLRSTNYEPRKMQSLGRILAAVLLLANIWTIWQVARQVRAQQDIVEDGNRRKIGEWLRAHATRTDTVFMEPLGYIGFYSDLKTFDWPGMSSREMVDARKQVGSEWGAIIRYLQPTWLVLRPFEVERVLQHNPGLLTDIYLPQQEFDRSIAVSHLEVHGRPYLEHDSHFTVFRLRKAGLLTLGLQSGSTLLPPEHLEAPGRLYMHDFNLHTVAIMGAPSQFDFPAPPDSSELVGGCGLLDDSWLGQAKVEPVEFIVALRKPDGSEQILLRRLLDPVNKADERGFRPFRLSLPQPLSGRLHFAIRATRPNAAPLHAFWGELEVIPLRTGLAFGEKLLPANPASQARFGFSNTEEDGKPCLLAHAPTSLVYDWQPGMNQLEAEFGIMRSALAGGQAIDGVVFLVEAENAAGKRTELYRRYLDPYRKDGDRGVQTLLLKLPPLPGGRLILSTEAPPSGHLNKAWSYWRAPRVSP